jgi:hypothetical protein
MAGCAQKPLPAPAAAVAADPFAYQQRSAVCTVSPIKAGPAGQTVSIATRSDDGLCAVAVAQPDGTAYASFLLQTLPAHGKAFIHNYNNQTLIDYTATTAYAGPDSFTVTLVPTAGGARTTIRIDAMVDATGVARPAAPVTPYVAPPGSTTHKTTHHTGTKKKKTKTN